MNTTERSRYLTRWSALKTERSSWDEHWQEIADYLLPRSVRFNVERPNDGRKRHNHIYDNSGIRALRVLAAGMMSGMTSPARPWFRLATPDEKLMEYEPVKAWLHEVSVLMRNTFARTNTYRSLHNMYEELGAFGTAGTILMPNAERGIHMHSLAPGEFAIATDAFDQVQTLYREYNMTVSQMVKQFGLDNCSSTVKNLYKNGRGLDNWVPVVHLMEPRYDRDPRKKDNLNMAYKSCYFEAGGDANQILRESGFDRFRGIVPRWMVNGGDVYGMSPAMEALGDVKQLQHEQLRKAEAIDYMVKPPIDLPTSAKFADVNRLPGGMSFTGGQQAGGRPLLEVRMDLSALLMDIQDVRGRIDAAFYADLFLMLSNDTRSGITATEVAERHEEKLLMLGPVLERLHNELLDPLIDMTFEELLKSGQLPEPPEELQGMELKIEFVSTLAQAQKAVGIASVDRLLGMIGGVAGMRPDVIDKINVDEMVDGYADLLGVDPTYIVAGEKLALIREQKAQQAQQQQAMAQAPAMAQTAQTLSQTPVAGDQESMLDSALAGLQGYS